MRICASLICLLGLQFSGSMLFGTESLTYGLAIKNSDYIQKALQEKSTKELAALFSEPIGEQIAATYIDEAFNQPLALVRLEGFLGGVYPLNATSALYVERALNDPHEVLRSFARKASHYFYDSFIQQKLFAIALTQKGTEQIEAFAVLAQQNKQMALEVANKLLTDKDTSLLEKIGIGEALSESLLRESSLLKTLIQQNVLSEEARLWLFSINPELIQEELVLQGLKSPSYLSQLGALECVGLWKSHVQNQMDQITPILRSMLLSTNIRIQAKAAWVSLCQIPELKEEALSTLKLLSQVGDKEAMLVSEVLCRLGQSGLVTASSFIQDPYAHPLCRMNALLTLIRFRSQLDKAPFELLSLLKKIDRPLKGDELSEGGPILFQTEEDESIERQLTRFQDIEARCSLLGLILTTSDSPEVERLSYFMASELLKRKSWGPLLEGGSQLFLQVGPKSIDFAKRLSQSLHEEVRIQTAGILAALGCERDALDILENCYPVATFEGKMTILSLLPSLPFQEALPFLIKAMKEKSSLLRTRGASVFLLMRYRNY